MSANGDYARELTAEDEAKLAELDQALAKFEAQKRWSDVIKTILAKAEIVVDPAQKVDLYSYAGSMYLDKSSNQAEAIKCYEQVLRYSPHNYDALYRLKEMYEKRRDWERLINVMRLEAELLDPDDRALRHMEMAQLATERLRKPEVCIDLWQLVLDTDPENPQALAALSNLYERAREFKKLADVLEKQSLSVTDAKELVGLLQKLGMIYADKLGDDEGAVRAFGRLLTIDPEDRRAQEQLKKRYVSLKAWNELEDFYAQTEKWDELIRTLEREAESKEITDDTRIDLFFRIARLWDTRKQKTDRAARSYEKVLELDPNNLDAAVALSPIYESVGDAKKLVGVYEVRLGHVTEPEERLLLLRETGLLYEERLKDPQKAFERFLEAFSVDPTREVTREDIERAAPAVNGWEQVIEAYTRAIETAQSNDDELDLRMRLGTVLGQVGRVDDAMQQLRAVYDARPEHVGAMQALEGLYRQTGRYRELHEVYERRAELEHDPAVRRQLAYDTAALWQTELNNPEHAIEAYQSIIATYGDDELEAYRALDTLYEDQGRWQDLASTLERRIDLGPASEEELAALKFRLARALEKHLGDKARAVELYREILSLMPEHDGAREALESLLRDPELGATAAQILEPIYEVRGDWERLVQALEVLLSVSPDPTERLDLLTKIGGICQERIGDAARAFDAYARALREAPDSETTLGRLEILAVEQERFRELVEIVSELAASTSDTDLSRTLWMKAAEIYDTQLSDVDSAVRAFTRVLDQDPADHEVLGQLESVYRRTERWRDLLGVLRRRAELAMEPDAKEEILSQMARIHEQMLNEPPAAISLYREILELDPTSQSALSALDDLFERQEMWSDLADNVGRRLAIAGSEHERTMLMLKMADLREKRQGAVDAAVETYREVLERDPGNSQALSALERLISIPEHQVIIAEVLEPIYRDNNDFQNLIRVHEIQVEHADSADRRVELLQRIAELYEVALDDQQNAFTSYARALAEDPANQHTQDQLERIARAFSAWESLAQVYEELTERVEEPTLKASLHVNAADIRENHLQDVERAIQHYQRVLELDSTRIESATALERLFQVAERYEDLATTYMAKAQMLDSPEEQKEYFFRAAAINEEILERPLEAVAVYDKILEVDPEEVRALDKLIELYLRLENWESLLGVYTRKADIVTDPEEKKQLLVEVGAVFEREIGDVAKAIDTYTRILEIEPDDMMALGRLDGLYQATQNWQELLSVLEREADLGQDPSEVISYRFRIADLWDHKLGDSIRAVEGYREILDVVPDHEPTLNALEAMVSEGREPVAAAGVLEPVYRQSGDWAKLIAVHEVQIKHENDPVRQVELLHQVAELYEFQLDRAEEAFQAYARALPLDNAHDTTLQSLERLADQLDAWRRVTELYDREIASLREENSERLVDMALRVAQIYEVQLNDVDAAIARYRTVLEADPGHIQAIEALDRLYDATERWAELADILDKEIQIAGTPDEVLNFQFRLGQVYQAKLNDVDRAIEQYREILAAAPEHGPALSSLELLFAEGVQPLVIGEILEPLYRMQEAWDRLVSVMEVQLQFQSDSAERVGMMHKIGEIAEDRANDHQRAFEWMQRALLEDPLHDHTNTEVERLSRILDGWGDLANTYADVISESKSVEVQTAIGRRLAHLYETELGDIQRAEETHRFVLSVNERDRETLEALDRIYVEHGAQDALSEVLRKRIAATTEQEELVDLNYRLGHVYEDLGRIDDAVRTYAHVIADLEPQHADSIRALANIYTEQQDWPNLYKTFEKELDVVFGDSAQAEVLAKMARLAADHLGDFDKAVGMWRKVLDMRGEDAEALNQLGDIYAHQQNWAELVEILEREVAIADDDETRIRIYSDLGRVWYEKLARERNALENWERVLDIDPANTDALFAIAAIHRAAGSNQELVDTLHRVIDVGAATLDDAVLEGVYRELGAVYSSTLERPMDAIEAYRHALDINPRNFETMDALERIHQQEAQWEDCIAVMEKRVEAIEDPNRKIEVLLAVARMWDEQVGEKDRATSAFERILQFDPMHDYAFGQLDELHRGAWRWEQLIELYIGRVEATQDVRERVALLRKVADVYEKELEEREKAFDALQVAWQEDFTDEATGVELERLAGLTQKWNELLTTANEALQSVTDPELKIAICLRCAKWYGTELGHPEYAIPYYQQILALDPANVPAMRQMADLYRATHQWQVLAQVLAQLVKMTEDPREKMHVYVQMGELAEQHLGVPDQASQYYNQALEIDAAHLGALDALERIYRERGKWNEVLEALRRKLDLLEDQESILDTKLAIAEIYEDRVGDADAAITTYRDVLATDAVNLQGLKGLERLYAQKERWQDLLSILEQEYEVVQSEKERVSILTRLAAMWEEEFVKPDKAAERLEQVIDIDPSHDGALRGLARLYRQTQRWDDLIRTYERHVAATPDRREKADLFKNIGEVFATELNDADHAIDAYVNLIQLDDDNVEALDALTRLYEKRGDHSAALDTMGQLSKLLQEPDQLVDLRYRMGFILDQHLGDRHAALEHYRSALDVEPGHLPSLESVRRIHVDNGDWLAAARVLESETQYQQNARAQAKLLVELGQIYDERLDEHDRAIEVFEQAHKQDADNEDAALPLIDEYTKAERWADARPLLEMIVRRVSKRPPDEQHRLWFLLGTAAEKLNDGDLSLKAFGQAYSLDSTHLPSLQGLAGSYYRLKEWDKAFKFYQMLLVHHRDSLGRDEITDIFYRLGVIKREQGERRKALNMFDKALEEDQHHRPTLEAVIGLYQAQNEWEQVIHFKKQMLDTGDDDERGNLLVEIGDLWKEKLRNSNKAIQSYQDAAELRGKDHVILHKLLALYQETKQWAKAIEIIDRVASLDERAAAKSKYAYTVAVIYRDELKDSEKSIEKFNEALDLDPSQLKAFEAINKIVTQKKDWKNLERAFRKMLHRIVGKTTPDLEFQLWHNLGVIYRDRLNQFENAAEAFKMASNLQPGNATEHQILAEIWERVPTRIDDAIQEHQWLLRQDPYRVDSYRSLYKLYFEARAYDKAWCLAATLTFLKKADQEQQQFFEQYRQRGMIRPQSRLDNERWIKDLFHPEEDLYVSKIFAAIMPAVLAIKEMSDKQAGLQKKHQVDPGTSTVTFAKTFGFVAQVLNLEQVQMMPRLFLRPDLPGGLASIATIPPATVCGSALLSGFNPTDLTFLVAKHLCYYRPEHFILTLLQTAPELKLALLAALQVVGLGVKDPAVDQTAMQLRQGMQPVHIEALRTVAKRFVDAGARADVKQWMQTTELTGCRAGYLICNDLEIAARMIQSEPPRGPGDLPPKEKIKEIVLFSVSEQYFRLREALGIQIQIG